MATQEEYQHIEFKKTLSELHEATIALAAFATAKGGEVRFGIDSDGKRTGIELGRNKLEELANNIKRNTDPPLFPSITVDGDANNAVVIVKIEESPIKPVWAFGTPYKRVGRTNQKISREETERLFDVTRGMTWDALPCRGLNIEHLSRALIESYLRRAGQDVTQATEVVLDNLNLRAGGVLLNGAALLFASNPQRWISGSQVKCARFQGTNSIDFIDEQTIEGDVISQIETTLTFVNRNTRHTFRISGNPERDIVAEYPDEAIREAVINAICHRDYAALGTVQVRIYEDRLEVWNPGSLPQGLSIEILYREHPSYPRNKRLADAFHRVRLIEHWGTGTLRIVAAYEAMGLPRPEFDEIAGAFIIRMRPLPVPTKGLDIQLLNDRQRKLLEVVVKQGRVKFAEFLPLSGVSERQTRYDLRQMVAKKYLKRVGAGPATGYELPDAVED